MTDHQEVLAAQHSSRCMPPHLPKQLRVGRALGKGTFYKWPFLKCKLQSPELKILPLNGFNASCLTIKKRGVCREGGAGVFLKCGTGNSPSSKEQHILCSCTIFHLAGLLFAQAGLDLLLSVSVPVPGIAQVPERNSSSPILGERVHSACPYLLAAFTSRDWVGLYGRPPPGLGSKLGDLVIGGALILELRSPLRKFFA